jgi:hypothetical protein
MTRAARTARPSLLPDSKESPAARHGPAANLRLEFGSSRPETLTPTVGLALQRLSGNGAVTELLSVRQSSDTSRHRPPARVGAEGSAKPVQRAFEAAEVQVAGRLARTRMRAAKPITPTNSSPRVDEAQYVGARLANGARVDVDWDLRDVTGVWVRARVGAVEGYIRVAKLRGGAAHTARPIAGPMAESAVVVLKGGGLTIPSGVKTADQLTALVKVYDDKDFEAIYRAKGGTAPGGQVGDVDGFRKGDEIFLRAGKQDIDTLIHEMLHLHSHDALKDAGGVVLNEGATEFFRLQVMAKARRAPAPGGPGYRLYLEAILLAVGASSSPSAILQEAYFSGDLGSLRDHINSRVDQPFQEFKEAFTDRAHQPWPGVAPTAQTILGLGTAWDVWLWSLNPAPKSMGGKYFANELLLDPMGALDPAGQIHHYRTQKAMAPGAPGGLTVLPLKAVREEQRQAAGTPVQRHETVGEEQIDLLPH